MADLAVVHRPPDQHPTRDQEALGMWIRLLLLLGVGGASLLLIKGHRGARHEAIRRLLLVAFVGAATLSVLLPQVWQDMADAIGVGRGTDLLLYALIVAFLGFVATSYLRFRDLQRQVTELTRRLALDEAPPSRTLDAPSVHPSRELPTPRTPAS